MGRKEDHVHLGGPMTGPGFLCDPSLKLLLFGGKGGTGKTSCAVSAAFTIARALPGQALLVSTDPAHSVSDSIAGAPVPENLTVLELDATACLDRFRKRNSHLLREIASRGTFLEDSEIDRFLNLSLPGLDELMAFFEISSWVDEGRYARIILDTAPTGHTLRLLGMPDFVRKWLMALDALLAKHRYMRAVFSRVERRDDLDEFLESLSGSVDVMEKLLTDPLTCRFIPVILAEPLSIEETKDLVKELKKHRISVQDAVVNRLRPPLDCPTCRSERKLQVREMEKLRSSSLLLGTRFWGIPLLPCEVHGAEPLAAFWTEARLLEQPTEPEPDVATLETIESSVQDPLQLPGPSAQFTIFAGKGGVGKTTMACASALRFSDAWNDGDVLLFSSDPAHSLSDCLGISLGPKPVVVAPGLSAVEMDAVAEFTAFKRDYADDLSRFLASVLRNFDLTFDRQVLERIMDLAPPGIDEIMALTEVMEVFSEKKFAHLVLDSAPTGHLIRLLEMPELVDQWLKTFFEVLLRYRNIVRLPKTAKTLITLSKRLKSLRTLLSDPRRTRLFTVAIPTEMALCETIDLISSCKRLKVPVSGILLNLVTLESTCPLCSRISERDRLAKNRFRDAFSPLSMAVIPRRAEPSGILRLEALGRELFVN